MIPKEWFDKMKIIIQKQYPTKPDKDITRIVAGIWYKKYNKQIRERLRQ